MVAAPLPVSHQSSPLQAHPSCHVLHPQHKSYGNLSYGNLEGGGLMRHQGGRQHMDVTVGYSCPSAAHVDCLHVKVQPGVAKDATARHATQDTADIGRTKETADIYGRDCRMWLPQDAAHDGLSPCEDRITGRPGMLLPTMPSRTRRTLVPIYLCMAYMI